LAAAGGDFGLGYSGFSSVTTFGLLVHFGLSLIGLHNFLAAFVVIVLVLATLAGVDSLFRLSVFLGEDLSGGTIVQFPSASCIVVMPSVPPSVSANFPSRSAGAEEFVFLTVPEYVLLDPDEVLERLDRLEATDDASLSWSWSWLVSAVFAELFEASGGFFSGWKYSFMVAFPLFGLFLWLRPLALFPACFAMVNLIFCLYLI